MKHTEKYTLWGNMYACDGVYIPDKITHGTLAHCLTRQETDPWSEYNGTYITKDDLDEAKLEGCK